MNIYLTIKKQTNKMKTLKYIFLVAMVAILNSACSNDTATLSENYPKDNRVRINTFLSAPLTKAGEQAYQGKDLGLFLDYGEDPLTQINVRWVNNGISWDPTSLMLWKNAFTPVNIYAYAPYQQTQDSPSASPADQLKIKFDIPFDQTDGTDKADLVTFIAKGFVPNEGLDGMEAVPIVFKHALVKFRVNIVKGNEYTDQDSVESVTLKRTASTVMCDFGNGGSISVPDNANEQDIFMYSIDNNSYEAVFSPHNGQSPGEETLVVKMKNGATYSYVVPAGGLGFRYGCYHTMTLKVGKDKIQVAPSLSVAGWVSDSLAGGEAE